MRQRDRFGGTVEADRMRARMKPARVAETSIGRGNPACSIERLSRSAVPDGVLGRVMRLVQSAKIGCGPKSRAACATASKGRRR
jgi:hypothetical protein